MTRVSMNASASAAVLRSPDGAKSLARLSEAILRDAKRNIRQMDLVDTGALLASGFVEPNGTEFRIGFDVDYASYVHEGTAPHEIRAKPGGVLAFPGAGGDTVFTRSVHHPGTQPQPFLSKAALRKRSSW
jgi:hypothetical protein